MADRTLVNWLALGLACVIVASCNSQEGSRKPMDVKDMLAAVRNEQIQFATTRPEESPFATLERQVVVIGPPSVVELTGTGDVRVLDALVEVLKDPDRAWAAEVVLAAMTGREDKFVDAFAAQPEQWWDALGKTSHERWSTWLAETRGKLRWDPTNRIFVETSAD